MTNKSALNDSTQKPHNDPTLYRGVIAWFAGNPVAANIVMAFTLLIGLFSMLTMVVEIFPETDMSMIRITVSYRGATPAEVEDAICLRVEDAIYAIEGIKRITSVASEGSGTVIASLETFADSDEVLDEIKTAIDRIETFPHETEKPIVTKASTRNKVISVAIFGDVSEKVLKQVADQVRDELTELNSISQVEINGVREYEISFEISDTMLRKHNLTFDKVASAINHTSLDLPAGAIKTKGGEILLRTKGQKYTGKTFENIEIITNNDGTKLLLKDIATIKDGFEDTDIRARFDGKPTAMLEVFRIGNQGAIALADTVKSYVAEKKVNLPHGIDIETWIDTSMFLKGRLDLLKRNGFLGIILVFISLALFLDLRLAFWTTLGIPISFLGSFMLLPYFDISINMISLFAFIVVLGIVVDDAIVVGENIFSYREKGYPPLDAAILGAREMVAPVTIAILTTMAAFMPLMFTEGMMGKFIYCIPVVAISVLAISLLEAFIILPAHLAELKPKKSIGPLGHVEKKIRTLLDRFIQGPFQKFLTRAIAYRYVTCTIGIMLFATTTAYISGGHIKMVFFGAMDADNVLAVLTMPQGTTRAQTEHVVGKIENAAIQLKKEFNKKDQTIIKRLATNIGTQPMSKEQGGPHGGTITPSAGNLAEINLELVPGQERTITAKTIANRWRTLVGEIPGISSLTYTSSLFDAGDAINYELSHENFDTLLLAAESLKDVLSQYSGVKEISDSFERGKLELRFSLTDLGSTLGLTLNDIATQIRQGYYGHEVQRIQRGRDDIRIMLRYPKQQRHTINDIERMRFHLADGTEVPFSNVANITAGRGFASINRANRKRIVNVTASVDDESGNSQTINDELTQKHLPELISHYPGLSFTVEGEQRERADSNISLLKNFCIALIVIFGLLAIQFKSYLLPIIIMSAIPFGIIGAVWGHVLTGYALGFMSFMGIVALTGVVVNDSLILVDLINRKRTTQSHLLELVRDCAIARFRPIILTTLTTFLGLSPMLFEESIQAKFLIPMALSLGFGVLFATMITLILIPSFYLILDDIKYTSRSFINWL